MSEVGVKAANTRLIQIALGLFFASGACGLVYQSIWPQYLKLLLGHSAYAQSIVLVVFIGGMAIGAWAATKITPSLRSPLLGYAACEALVGAIAIVFHSVYLPVSDWVYAYLLPNYCSESGSCAIQWAVAAGLIAPQSILLGATFPFLVSGLIQHAQSDSGRVLSAAYGLNTLGAVLGVLLSTFVLIPNYGLPGAMLTVGLCNLLVGLGIYLIDKQFQIADAGFSGVFAGGMAQKGTELVSGYAVLVMYLLAAATGFSSFVYEVVWIRMLGLVLGSATHTFEIVLACYLFGLGCGGLWIRRRIDKIGSVVLYLVVAQMVMGGAAAFTALYYHQLFEYASWIYVALGKSNEGYLLYLLSSGVIASLVVFPATFCAGMTLPLITRYLLGSRQGQAAIGRVYSINTIGAILGVLATVHFGFPAIGMHSTLIVGAVIDVLIALVACSLLLNSGTLHVRKVFMCSVAVFLVVLSIGIAHEFDAKLLASGVFRNGVTKFGDETAEVLYHEDGKTATVSVGTDSSGVRVIKTNGKPDAAVQMNQKVRPSDDEYTMVLLGFAGIMHNPSARNAAVIGFGSGMSSSVILSSRNIKRVDTIEIEPKMVEGARNFLPIVAPAFEDRRSHVVIDDAKAYFSKTGNKYDLILAEPSNPWVSGVSTLFSKEFYERAKLSMSEGGVFVQWLQLYEFNPELLASVFSALDIAFGDYQVYVSTTDMVIVASKGRLSAADYGFVFSGVRSKEWLRRVGIESSLDIERLRVARKGAFSLLLKDYQSPTNSDFFPYVDIHAPAARFARSNASFLSAVASSPVPVVDWIDASLHGSQGGIESAVYTHNGAQSDGRVGSWPLVVERYLSRSVNHEGVEHSINRGALGDLVLMRDKNAACESRELASSYIDSVLKTAGSFRGAERREISKFWNAYSVPNCRYANELNVAGWKRLTDAVLSDNFPAVVETSSSLVKSGFTDMTAYQREYLMLAHIGALAALRQYSTAVDSVKFYKSLVAPSILKAPWFVMLRNYLEAGLAASNKKPN